LLTTALSTPGRARDLDERGYSVIEMVIVLGLIAILLSVGVTSVRQAMAREEIDGWVRAVVADIAAGQQAAITRRATVTATFSSRTYTIAVSGNGTIRQDTVPAHITFGDPPPLSFDRRGVPSLETGWAMTVRSTSTGRTYTVRVEAATGRASYSEP